MFTVVRIDLSDDGCETRYLRYRAKTSNDCWNYIFNLALHPLKEKRVEAKKLFVFDSFNRMLPFVPRHVRRVLID